MLAVTGFWAVPHYLVSLFLGVAVFFWCLFCSGLVVNTSIHESGQLVHEPTSHFMNLIS
jgi:hypothetical protein